MGSVYKSIYQNKDWLRSVFRPQLHRNISPEEGQGKDEEVAPGRGSKGDYTDTQIFTDLQGE